jgi:hypothetical protein
MRAAMGDILYCDSFPGGCCSSCHEDDELGYHDLPEVEGDDESVFARVCCQKLDEALAAKAALLNR